MDQFKSTDVFFKERNKFFENRENKLKKNKDHLGAKETRLYN